MSAHNLPHRNEFALHEVRGRSGGPALQSGPSTSLVRGIAGTMAREMRSATQILVGSIPTDCRTPVSDHARRIRVEARCVDRSHEYTRSPLDTLPSRFIFSPLSWCATEPHRVEEKRASMRGCPPSICVSSHETVRKDGASPIHRWDVFPRGPNCIDTRKPGH